MQGDDRVLLFVRGLEEPVRLEKYSAKTYVKDITRDPHMPEEFKGITQKDVKYVWRCKIGMRNRWSYGWNMIGALLAAIKNAGMRLPT